MAASRGMEGHDVRVLGPLMEIDRGILCVPRELPPTRGLACASLGLTNRRDMAAVQLAAVRAAREQLGAPVQRGGVGARMSGRNGRGRAGKHEKCSSGKCRRKICAVGFTGVGGVERGGEPVDRRGFAIPNVR